MRATLATLAFLAVSLTAVECKWTFFLLAIASAKASPIDFQFPLSVARSYQSLLNVSKSFFNITMFLFFFDVFEETVLLQFKVKGNVDQKHCEISCDFANKPRGLFLEILEWNLNRMNTPPSQSAEDYIYYSTY